MDALSMAAPSSRSLVADELISPASAARIPARIKKALAALLQAHDYAQDLQACPWEFAIEIATLRALKLSNSDLRWLVARDIVDHGVEVTVGDSRQRSFQHPERLRLARKACFVLTETGVPLARRLQRLPAEPEAADVPERHDLPSLVVATPPPPQSPTWDRDRHELRVGRRVVKQFKIPNVCQESILAVFEEMRWPERIDDPLPDEGAGRPLQLQQAIDALNRHQKHALIEFCGDGEGVRWMYHAASEVAE
ncbi:MAG: hypothetical protein DWQ37_03580 [Planctomycetota bacterium]|nr:MAG: hypothetical protein DWQ37_03580 [Planctomycetota bacterium]